MKWFTYARTIWHEFWMYMLVGSATPGAKEEGLAPRPGAQELLYDVPEEPLKANYSVKTSWLLTRRMNEGVYQRPTLNFGPTVKLSKKLWVYNVSRVDHKFDHPMLGEVTIPGNTTKKRYAMWTSFPDVVSGLNYCMDTNVLYPHHTDGEYFVKDLINPDHIYGDSGHSTAIGRDLSVRGVFWSYNNPPKVSEVNAAISTMKAHYADLLERMSILWESAQLSGERLERYMRRDACDPAIGEITPEHHAAAEYLKVTTPWHPVIIG